MRVLDWLFGPPSRDRFAKKIIEAFRLAGSGKEILYQPDGFRLVVPGDGERVAFLENTYQEYCAAAKPFREQILRKVVRYLLTPAFKLPEHFEDLHPDLLPAVRSRMQFESSRLSHELEYDRALSLPYHVLGEHFGVGLVYDLPEAMQYIGHDDLEGWGVTFYEAMEAARENLNKMPCQFVGPEGDGGLYISASQDGHDATRLLMVDLIRQFDLVGEPIAAVPNRDNLFVTGSEDVENLRILLNLVREKVKEPRFMSSILLRLDGDEWVTWMPEPDHPLHREFHTLYVQSLGGDYSEQKELLEALHAKQGGPFVAGYIPFGDKQSGDLFSVATWTEGVDTLLPQADLVAFVSASEKTAIAPWESVMRTMGAVMEPVDLYPIRYRVDSFPTPEELEAMGAREQR